MIVAIISDLHDNVRAWELFVRDVREFPVETIINCGDTVAPAMLQKMSRTFSGQIHTVFGNNADRELETTVTATLPNITQHGDRGAVHLVNRRIGFVHYPEVADSMAATGEFDLVCHGHTHFKRWEKIGSCYILNPGTLGGMFQYPSWATVDLTTLSHEFHELHI